MKKKSSRRDSRAFTIVEILVVVVIIALLAGLIVPKFGGRVGQAKQSIAKQNVTSIEQAIEIFYYDYDRWPHDLDELVTRPDDIEEADWSSPTLKAKDLTDPWKRKYNYLQPGDHGTYDVYTLGKDGQEGGEGENADIGNWE